MDNLRSVLVHLDSSPHSTARLSLARALAARSGAVVDAYYAVENAYETTRVGLTEGSDLGVFAAQFDADRRRRARANFDRVAAQAGAPVEWHERGHESVVGGVLRRAQFSDLVVVGQRDPSSPSDGDLPASFVEWIVIDSGKPVLVIPFANAATAVAERVLVAWRATRESSRALDAALPLLRRAERVDVVSWESKQAPVSLTDRQQLGRFLDRHGIRAALHWQPAADGQTGDALLSRAFQLGSDLIVMGCYGHSRAREMVLGGVTRTVLRSMTVPVLMAH